MNKPTNFAIPSSWMKPQLLLLTREVTPPNTW